MSMEGQEHILERDHAESVFRAGRIEVMKQRIPESHWGFLENDLSTEQITAYFDAMTRRDEMIEARGKTPFVIENFKAWDKVTQEPVVVGVQLPEGNDARPLAVALYPWCELEPEES